MDIKNFLLRKQGELSSNSTDDDERKRLHKASSLKFMEILKKARLEHWFTNPWTPDGKILYKSSTENKVNLYYK